MFSTCAVHWRHRYRYIPYHLLPLHPTTDRCSTSLYTAVRCGMTRDSRSHRMLYSFRHSSSANPAKSNYLHFTSNTDRGKNSIYLCFHLNKSRVYPDRFYFSICYNCNRIFCELNTLPTALAIRITNTNPACPEQTAYQRIQEMRKSLQNQSLEKRNSPDQIAPGPDGSFLCLLSLSREKDQILILKMAFLMVAGWPTWTAVRWASVG